MKLFRTASLALLALGFFVSPASAATTGTLLPVSDGNYLQWTPSTGATHYTLVDETTCNGTTDYTSTNTVGNRDSYGISLSSLPDGSTITQIDLTPCASKNGSGGSNSTLNVFYRLNGVDSADAGAYSVSGTTPTGLSTTSFSGIAINKSSSTTLEVGAVLSAGTKGARLGRLAAVVTYTPLGTPSGVVAVATGSAIDVGWNDSSTNEDGYSIERSDNGGAYVEVGTVGANIKMFSDPGLSVGTYTYRIRTYNSGGYSNYSNVATAYVLAVPTSLSATAASSSVTLTWVDNAINEDGYKIERRVSGVGSFVEIKTVATNSASTTDLNRPVGDYEYRVRAYKGVHRSEYSNTDDVSVLAIPTNVFANVTGSDVTVNWTDNSSNEEGFYIERRLVGGSYSVIDSVAADVTTYLDDALASGNYQYRVKAYKNLDISGPSATASATVF